MALAKNATDGVINGWKNSNKLGQQSWKGKGSRGNYGQVLKGGGKPSDQALDGPPLPNNPNVAADARMDVYEAPNGYGWSAYFEAVENPGSVRWFRTVSCHENGPLMEPAWALVLTAQI